MDEDLRNAFATLSAQISVVATDLRANTSLTADLTRSVAEVSTEQKSQGGRLSVVEKAVFGSDPPPAPPTRPITESVGEHEGDIAHLAGRTLAVEAKVDKLTEMQERQTELLEKIWKAVSGLFANPTVQRIAALVGALILSWLTAKTTGVLK